MVTSKACRLVSSKQWVLPGCFITDHVLDERECLQQATHRARRTEPGIGRQWLAGQTGAIEAAKRTCRVGILRQRPARPIGILDLLQPQPAGLSGTLLDSEAAWRSGSTRQVGQQAGLVGQRLALPINRMVDLARGGVPCGGGRPDDLEDERPTEACTAVSGSSRDTIDSFCGCARARADWPHLPALDRNSASSKCCAHGTREHCQVKR